MQEQIQSAEQAVKAAQQAVRASEVQLREAQKVLHRLHQQERALLKDPQLSVLTSDDYAVLDAGKCRYYYGYEVVGGSGEWCFKAEFGGMERVIPGHVLAVAAGLEDGSSPALFLLAGIGLTLLEEW